MLMTQSVAMIGLGKLGLPVAEAMAKHYTVYGYDTNKDIKSDTVTICDKLYHAVHDVAIVFIAMPTPHDPEYGGEKPIASKIKKDFSYEALDTCLSEIENYVEPGTIVVTISTVLPGTYRKLARKHKKIENLVNKMFKDFEIVDQKLEKEKIEENGFVSQISFYDFKGDSKFETFRNTGIYQISLDIKIEVSNSSKNITNDISSSMNWEKNIFLNCNLQNGAVKSGQKALENLIERIYETTYESIFQIKR